MKRASEKSGYFGMIVVLQDCRGIKDKGGEHVQSSIDISSFAHI